jgi:hypothetical protein
MGLCEAVAKRDAGLKEVANHRRQAWTAPALALEDGLRTKSRRIRLQKVPLNSTPLHISYLYRTRSKGIVGHLYTSDPRWAMQEMARSLRR